SSSNILHELDPEIDRTLRRLRKVRSVVVSNSNNFNSISNSDNSASATNESNFFEYSSSDVNSHFNFGVSKSQESKPMENNDQTFKELATLDMSAQSYELKSDLIHLLSKFHGLAGEDPYKHLKEFHVVCSTMRSQGIPEDYIKMKIFPFSLDGAAKDQLYLQPIFFKKRESKGKIKQDLQFKETLVYHLMPLKSNHILFLVELHCHPQRHRYTPPPPQTFVDLIWHYISSSKIKVLWNDDALEEFKSSRDIHQGDLIS
ncbi:hypothetical protein CR513_07326, partial [Mucuna pruriens]